MHHLVADGATYEAISAALDAVAALPEAIDPDATALLALERLDAVSQHGVSDAEVERVLDAVAAELAAMPTHQRAWLLRRACWSRRELAERHLAPLLAALEAREPEDWDQITLESIRVALAVARGEPREGEGDDDLESSWTPPPELERGMWHVRRLMGQRWPYDDVIKALEQIAALPSADSTVPLAIAWERFALVSFYARPDEEVERVIQETAPVIAHVPVKYRADTISAACMGRPVLAERYVPALIEELEDDLRANPDEVGEQVLASLKRDLERTRAGA